MKRRALIIELHDAADADSPPFAIRLRIALKFLLRRCGLRCASITQLAADTPQTSTPADTPEGFKDGNPRPTSRTRETQSD